jgi:hypothetical protein
MARLPLLLPAVALMSFLAALPVAQASPVIPEEKTVVRVELELAASDGFQAQLETSEKGVATLRLAREGGEVIYSTPAVVTEEGLRVRFGRLGRIDAVFTPTTTLSSTEPGQGCRGKPRTLHEGVYSGTIEFRGERGYVRIEALQAAGSMSVLPPWECPEAESLAPFANASRPAALLRPRSAKGKPGAASLYAAGRHCQCLFGAGVRSRRAGGESVFFGARHERREGMEISRSTLVRGGAGAFLFDHSAGTATLRPPPPLRGQANFDEQPGRDLWRSTIRVPFLGADPLRTDGPGFQASLSREFSFGR